MITEKQREYKRNRNPKTRRAENLKAKYRLTYEQYQDLYNQQHGLCAICKKFLVFEGSAKTRYQVARIDHCHVTNKVRGLLCDFCNKGLGFFLDNPTLLQSAKEYIENANS